MQAAEKEETVTIMKAVEWEEEWHDVMEGEEVQGEATLSIHILDGT